MEFNENQAREIFFNRFTELREYYNNHINQINSMRIKSNQTPMKLNWGAVDPYIKEIAQTMTVMDTGYHFDITNLKTLSLSNFDHNKITAGQQLADYVVTNSKESDLSPLKKQIYQKRSTELMNKLLLPFDAKTNEFFDQFKNPTNFIRADLYTKSEDIGILNKRTVSGMQYESDMVAELDALINRYTERGSGSTSHIPLTDWEKDLYEKHSVTFFGDEGKEPINMNDPEFYRNRIEIMKESAQKKIDTYKWDIKEVEIFRNILRDYNYSKGTPLNVIMANKYGGFSFVDNIVKGAGENPSDKAIMLSMMEHLGSDKRVRRIAFMGNEHERVDNLINKLNRVVDSSKKGVRGPYQDVYVFNQFTSDFWSMIKGSKYDNIIGMEEERRIYDSEARTWMERENTDNTFANVDRKLQAVDDNGNPIYKDGKPVMYDGHEKVKTGFLSDEEIRDLYENQNELNKITDYNEYVRKIRKAQIDAVEDKSKVLKDSPTQKIEDALVKRLIGVDQTESEKLVNSIKNQIEEQTEKNGPLSKTQYDAILESWGTNAKQFEQLELALRDGNRQPNLVNVYKVKDRSTKNDKVWKEATKNKERVFIDNNQVAFIAQDFKDGYVTLQKETVKPNNIIMDIDVNGDIAKVIKEMEDNRYRSSLNAKDLADQAKRVVKNNIVEVVFNQSWDLSGIKESHEHMYNQLNTAYNVFGEKAKELGISTDKVRVANVPIEAILDQYNNFWTNVDDNNKGAKIHPYLKETIKSHMSWMLRDGKEDEVASSAYLALSDAITELGDGKTINLTDEHLLDIFKKEELLRTGKEATEEAIADFKKKSLDTAPLHHRLGAFLHGRILGKLHEDAFDGKNKYKTAMVLNIEKTLQNTRAAQDGMMDTISGSAEEIFHHIRGLRNEIKKYPTVEKALLDITLPEIEDILKFDHENARGGGGRVLSLDIMHGVGENKNGIDLEEGHQTLKDGVAPDDAFDPRLTELTYDFEKEERRTFKVPKRVIAQWERGEISAGDIVEKYKGAAIHTLKNFRPNNASDVELALEIAQAVGQNSIKAKVGGESAVIRYGNQGEILVDLLDSGRTVGISESIETQRHRADQINYRKAYGGDPLADIVDNGTIKRTFPAAYEEVQRKGKGVTQASPSATLDVLHQFMQGDMQMTYMDMETTGVDNSKLPKRMLQPLEIYMQKMEWNPDVDDFRRAGKNKQIAVKENGRNTIVDKHLFIKPTDDMEKYMNQIIQGEDFMIQLNEETAKKIKANKAINIRINKQNQIAITDFMNLEKDFKTRSATEEIRNIIGTQESSRIDRKSSRLWYLRNIAKYSMSDTYEQHAGNETIRDAKEYIDVLKQDAKEGLQNLQDVHKEGRDRYVYSKNQQAIGLKDVIKEVTDFAGDDAIAGQNFAEADWTKVVKAGQDTVKEKESIYRNALDNLLNDIRTDKVDALDKLAYMIGTNGYARPIVTQGERKVVKKRWDYRHFEPIEHQPDRRWVPLSSREIEEMGEEKLNKDLATRRITMVSGRSKMGQDGDVMYYKNMPALVEETVTEKVPIIKHIELTPDEINTLGKEQIQQMVKDGDLVQSYRSGLDTPTLDNLFNYAKEKGIKISGNQGVDNLRQMITKLEDIEIELNEGKGLHELSEGNRSFLDAYIKISNSSIDTSVVDNALTDLQIAKDTVDNLGKPRIMEQMFLSKMANPDMKSHSAENQIKQAKQFIGDTFNRIKGSLHLADYDVKAGMETIGQWIRQLKGDGTLDGYDNADLQIGDVIQHKRQVHKNIPLGIYEVSGVDNASHKIHLKGLDGNDYTVTAGSQAELSKRYNTHFSFVDTDIKSGTTKNAIDEFGRDAARQQISTAINSAQSFDYYQLRGNEYLGDAPANEPLQKLNDIYNASKVVPNATPTTDVTLDDGMFERKIAEQNAPLLESMDIKEKMADDLSIRRKEAYNHTFDFYNSNEGIARKAFLDDVDKLQQSGVIKHDEASEMIRQMNEHIKAEGKKRGYTRNLDNKINVGNVEHENKMFQSFEIDITNKSTAAASIWKKAQDYMHVGFESLTKEGKTGTENEAKGRVINQLIMPYLRDNGYINDYNEKTPTVAHAVNQIMKKDIPLAEEYDYLRYKDSSENVEFLDSIRQKHQDLTAEHMTKITPLQQIKLNRRAEMVEEMKAKGIYHPDINFQVDLSDIKTEAIKFDKYGGIGLYSAGDLKAVSELLSNAIPEEATTRNIIFNELFKRATVGSKGTVAGLNLNSSEAVRLEAMEALNWINKTDSGYDWNPNLSEYHLGLWGNNPAENASVQFKNLPMDSIDRIVSKLDAGYTEDNSKVVAGLLSQWKNQQNFVGRNPDAPQQTPTYKKIVNPTDAEIDSTNMDDAAKEQLKASIEQTKAEGKKAAMLREMSGEGTRDRAPGAIEEQFSRAKNAISDTKKAVTEAIKDSGVGKAGKWIVGLGVAGYALKQFMTAGSPLKFEQRPTSHGVAGIVGENENDKTDNVQNNNVDLPQKAYADTKGYTVSAKAKDRAGVNFQDISSKLQEQIGDVNFNIRDDRTSMDRNWLSEQISTFLDRGHL